MTRPSGESAARRRIVETADRLFYADGVRAVGVDRVIAEAGVAKMTLYHHFAGKDALIVAALEHRDAAVMAYFRAAVDDPAVPPAGRLAALFGALKAWFAAPDFRGCAFLNAVAGLSDPGHPGHAYALDHKRRFLEVLRPVVAAAGGSPADAPAILMLINGAIFEAAMTRSADAADVARGAAEKLIRAKTV